MECLFRITLRISFVLQESRPIYFICPYTAQVLLCQQDHVVAIHARLWLKWFQLQEFCGSSCWCFKSPVPWAMRWRDFRRECSSPAQISSDCSSVSTWHFDSIYVSTYDCLNWFTSLRIFSLCGNVTSTNLRWNLLFTFRTEPLFT